MRFFIRGLGSLVALAPVAIELPPRASAAERMRHSFERVGLAINRPCRSMATKPSRTVAPEPAAPGGGQIVATQSFSGPIPPPPSSKATSA
jgi:hypothetical protein